MNLVDSLQMSNSPVIDRVIMNLGMHNPLMSKLDWIYGKELRKELAMYDGLNAPSVPWSDVGDAVTEVSGKFERASATMYLSRAKILMDKVYAENPQSIGDPLDTQLKMYIKAWSHDFNAKFINNNIISGNTKSFDGLRGRFAKRSSYGIPAELARDLSGADMRVGSITATVANTVMRNLDEMLMVVSGGSGNYSNVVLFCNDTVMAALNHAARLMGGGAGFQTAKDAFDRQVTTYNGAQFVNPGLNYPYRSLSRIMTNSETAAGTASTGGNFSSIFAVRFGTEADPDGYVPWFRHDWNEAVTYIPRGVNDAINEQVVIDVGASFILTDKLALGHMFNFRVK